MNPARRHTRAQSSHDPGTRLPLCPTTELGRAGDFRGHFHRTSQVSRGHRRKKNFRYDTREHFLPTERLEKGHLHGEERRRKRKHVCEVGQPLSNPDMEAVFATEKEAATNKEFGGHKIIPANIYWALARS